jgi:hypothetical protein
MTWVPVCRWLLVVGVTGLAGTVPTRSGNDLTLEPAAGSCCVRAGQNVTVWLKVSNLLQPINGVQVLVGFDPGVLSLDDIIPGDGVDSPWNDALGVSDIEGGDITYSIAILGGSTDEDAVVARFVFTALADGVTEVNFRPPDPPLMSKLTAYPSLETIIPDLHGPAYVVIAAPGDSNADGQIDLADFADFAACVTGPAAEGEGPAYPLGPPHHCSCFDFDGDNDVDLFDFAEFTVVFTGA